MAIVLSLRKPMMIQTLIDRFTKAPVAVMVRAMLANVWSDQKIDQIFRDTAVR